jgi:hypothetical protein
MNGPYRVMRADRSGEDELAKSSDPEKALIARDAMHKHPNAQRRAVSYRVLSDDVDPPESGEVEWCQACLAVAVLGSTETCAECDEDGTTP